MIELNKVDVQCFRACDFPSKCKDYSKGRDQVLIDYGFIDTVKPNVDWHKNENTIVALVYWEDEAIAGMRMDLERKDVILPIESAVKNNFPEIRAYLASKSKGKYAEGNGTWNAKSVSGLNFSQVLTRYLYSVALNIDIVTIFSFQARFARRIVENYGAQRLKEIGDDGWISYPTDKYLAGIYFFEDINVFNFKQSIYSERIQFLSSNLSCKNQIEIETKNVLIEYQTDKRVLKL